MTNFDDAIEWIGILVVAAFLIWLAIKFLIFGLNGAIFQLEYATSSGFIGVIVFFAAWVFLFPVMVTWAVIWGFIEFMKDRYD